MSSLSEAPNNFQELIKTIMPDTTTLQNLLTKFEMELDNAINNKDTLFTQPEVPNVRVMDFGISEMPETKRLGRHYCVSIEKDGIIGAYITLKEDGHSFVEQAFVSYNSIGQKQKIPLQVNELVEPQMTATIFVQAILAAIEAILEKSGKRHSPKKIPFVLVSNYFLAKHSLRTEFAMFHELIDMKKLNNDPLVKLNITYLIRVQLQLHEFPVEIVSAITHSSARLLYASWECMKQPCCLVALHIGDEVQATYYHMNQKDFLFTGSLLDVDFASFNGNYIDQSTYCTIYGLPYTEADFEVNRSPNGNQLYRDYEKMVSAKALPEVCRLLVLRTFEMNSPKLAWVRNSLSISHCLEILDDDQFLTKTKQILSSIWGCDDSQQIKTIRKVIVSTFSRSAALAAMAIAALAKRTGRLQPALGGVRIVLSGCLGKDKIYQGLLQHYINKLFNRDMSQILKFYVCKDSATIKGGAVHGLEEASKKNRVRYTQ